MPAGFSRNRRRATRATSAFALRRAMPRAAMPSASPARSRRFTHAAPPAAAACAPAFGRAWTRCRASSRAKRCMPGGGWWAHEQHQGAAPPCRPRPHWRQGRPLQRERHRLPPLALRSPGRAGDRGARGRALRASPSHQGEPLSIAEARRHELRDRRRARRRRERLAQPRYARQGARLPAAGDVRRDSARAGKPSRSGAAIRDRNRLRNPMKRSLAALAASLALMGSAFAQDYPSKGVTFVVPFAAGSATDQLARAIGQSVSTQSKQAVVVDNKPGSSGFLAAQNAANASPDGYTVLIPTNTTHAANEHLYKSMPYDPVKDFAPVTLLGKGGQIMVVNLKVAAKTVQEFIALAKKDPGKYSFGSGSSSSRIAGELFQQMAGVQLLHVPYKSNPLAITDLLGGQIDMMITDNGTGLPHVHGRKLRAVGRSR